MTKAFSSPGKALLAGGYLVLDPEYDAYVIALSARMHAIIKSDGLKKPGSPSSIKVASPQFRQGEWEWECKVNASNRYDITEVKSRRNPFLEAAIRTVLAYFQPRDFHLEITIYSDPGYHSQENTRVKSSANGEKSFLFHQMAINDVPKTGLGSSAGLVTVVSAALMSHFAPGSESSSDLLHNIAQVAHCLAQKKIGSGFDVAAAVYGSIIYRRFQPLVMNEILEALENASSPETVKSLIDKSWDFKHERCALPRTVRLLMGDIQGGSETPKMVSKIMQWRKDDPARAREIYKQLDMANAHFTRTIEGIGQALGQDAESSLTASNVDKLASAIREIRSGLQALTAAADVPVEPQVQTKLLDNVGRIKGCLGGVVPGAGGYDAIAVLALTEAVKDIKSTTAASPELYNNVHWVDLHEEAEGVRCENPDDYVGL
ncbi:uncharacterized protein LODBEIA_P48770 [Lodderomyces beijingensis]|uniref:Phosphomevalonate kinase n=1 Tax=Lodderomyces beijingensis TaxID=1775926 RepID=A0ABP0ZSI8_9ASCO